MCACVCEERFGSFPGSYWLSLRTWETRYQPPTNLTLDYVISLLLSLQFFVSGFPSVRRTDPQGGKKLTTNPKILNSTLNLCECFFFFFSGGLPIIQSFDFKNFLEVWVNVTLSAVLWYIRLVMCHELPTSEQAAVFTLYHDSVVWTILGLSSYIYFCSGWIQPDIITI